MVHTWAHGTREVFFPQLCSNVPKEGYSGVWPQLHWQKRALVKLATSALRVLTFVLTRTCVSERSSAPVHASANNCLRVMLARLNWCKQCVADKDEFSNVILSDECFVQLDSHGKLCFRKRGQGMILNIQVSYTMVYFTVNNINWWRTLPGSPDLNNNLKKRSAVFNLKINLHYGRKMNANSNTTSSNSAPCLIYHGLFYFGAFWLPYMYCTSSCGKNPQTILRIISLV